MSLHSSSSVNGEGSTPKDPLYKILDDLRSLSCGKKNKREKKKEKVIWIKVQNTKNNKSWQDN